MLNVFAIAKPEERPETQGYNWFRVAPADLYPATAEHVAKVLAGPRPAGPLGQLYDRGIALGADKIGFVNVLKDGLDQEVVTARKEALEICRLWFTEMLQSALGEPIGMHITKDEKYRL